MSNMTKFASKLQKIISETDNKKTKPYDTQAKVLRVDNDVVWVHIPGGVDETPIRKTINAIPGDNVQVHIENGSAWMVGNTSVPPTGDARANEAYMRAEVAAIAADSAVADAGVAREAASSAQSSATEAKTIAEGVEDIAKDAQESADSAKQSADTAFTQLSIIEDIVGVLDLIAKNGDYDRTNDQEAILDKWYFERKGIDPDYTYSVVALQTFYRLTDDVEITEGKIYYIRNGTEPDYIYTPVANPVVEDLDIYYEAYQSPREQGLYELRDVKAAIRNYISSHLVLDSKGLWLKSNNPDSKVFISAETGKEGVYLFAGGDEPVAQYTNIAIIGKPKDFHIEIGSKNGSEPEIGFYKTNDNKVAYLNEQELYVANRLSFGHFTFVERTNGHFSLRLIRS